MQLAATPFPLGRLAAEDPRSFAFPMSDFLPPLGAALPDSQFWGVQAPLDQGATSSCVGYSMRGLLEATPSPVPPGTGPDGWTIYQKALTLDHIPGTADTGTSMVAGAKAGQALGYVKTFVWGQQIYDVVRWILLYGPVVIGIPWFNGMFYPDANGVIRPTGNVVGGHAILVYGYDQKSGFFRLQNSWGRWGSRGRCWVFHKDMNDLIFNRGGEALAATEV